MKILRIVSELNFGGVEQVMSNSIPELRDRIGVEVRIVVLGKGGRVERELLQKGVDVFVFNNKPKIPNLKLVFRLRRFIKECNPDVIHCQGAEANFHGILAGRWAGVKTIIGEEIGIPNHHGGWKHIFKWIYSKADTVIAVSEAVKNYIVELGEINAEKVEVLYNPVRVKRSGISRKRDVNEIFNDPTFGINKSGVREDGKIDLGRDGKGDFPFVFITTCRLVPVKNLDSLIKVFANFVQERSDEKIQLWIVGDGPLKETLYSQVEDLKIENSVRFWGFQKNVFYFLEYANVFLLPSLSEGSPVSLAEAMACGLPSIVSNVGGACEIIGSSESGFLVDPYDSVSIKNGLTAMVNLSGSERRLMGARAKVESERFSPKTYLNTLLNIYKRLS